jgi:hypothetical protein
MLSGFIAVGVLAVLICGGAVAFLLRPPSCPTCRIPLQVVEETVRDFGHFGLETVTYYECSDCYRGMRRLLILTHIG